MSISNHEEGFSFVEILLVILVVLVIGFGGYWVYSQNQSSQNTTNESQESSVGRDYIAEESTDVLLVPELGVKLLIDYDVTDIVYVINDFNNAELASVTLADSYPNCDIRNTYINSYGVEMKGIESGFIGSYTDAEANDQFFYPGSTYEGIFGDEALRIDGVNYFVVHHFQSPCLPNTATSEHKAIESEFREAVKTSSLEVL